MGKGTGSKVVSAVMQKLPAVFIDEVCQDDEYVKISIRSQGDFAANTICEKHFNGGGHKNAAGGEFYGTVDEARAEFYKIMEEMKPTDGEENDNK